MLSTAAAEVYDPAIRKRLQEVIAAQEMMVLDCLNEEKTALHDPDCAPLLAKTLTAFLHSISLRAGPVKVRATGRDGSCRSDGIAVCTDITGGIISAGEYFSAQ